MLGKLDSRGLMTKLVACFVAVSAAQIMILGYLSFESAKEGLEQAAFERLYSERELRRKELLRYFKDTVQSLRFMAQTPTVRSAVETLQSYYDNSKVTPDAPFDAKSASYEQMYASINPFFKSFLDTHETRSSGYEDLYLVSATDMIIMYTAKKSKDLGVSLRRDDLKNTGPAKLCEKIIKTKKTAMVDFESYEPAGKPVLFVGVPVFGTTESLDGVLIVRIGPEEIDSIFGSSKEVGEASDAYVVGSDLLMRSQGSSVDDASLLRRKVDTDAAQNALQGKSGTGILKNYRDKRVLSSYSPAGLTAAESLGADFNWAVVAEIGADAAFASVHTLRNQMILIALAIALVSVLVAFTVGRTIVKPIVALAEKVARIGERDLTVDIPAQTRRDEVGALARAIETMVTNLREQIGQLGAGVGILSSASSKISTTVAEVATSSAETSAAITETTVTAEQVSQAAKMARERAKSVASTARASVKTSAEGKQATDDTVRRMRVIKEQMESIGETVVRLSEHTQTIEDIIGSVQDLADQSNLLAVNASIEAARAGDQGKGFAVVAHEIKDLADESKDATDQVRSMLEDTRKWVNAVVMATEQGIKAVESGMEQSVFAGQSIEKLSESVSASAQAASEIESFSEQQSMGIDRVSAAMASIEEAMEHNKSGMSQLEEEANKLAQLGEDLNQFLFAALPAAPLPAAAADSIKIGIMYSLTGPVAAIAKLQKQGAELAVKDVNDAGGVDIAGKKMKLEAIFCDDRAWPRVATECYEDMVKNRGVTVVVAGSATHIPSALNIAAKKDKALVMATCAAPDSFFTKEVKAPTSLSILGGGSDIGRAAASYLGERLKPKKVACFLPVYEFGTALAEGFEEVMKKYSNITYKIFWHPLGSSDIRRDLQAVRDFKPDLIAIGSWGKDHVNALTEAANMGLGQNAKIFGIWTVNAIASAVPPDAMKGVLSQIFWYHDMTGFKDESVVNASNEFSAKIMKVYKDPPDPLMMLAYYGVKEAVRAMELAQSTDPTKMYEALMANPVWTGPKGEARWRKDGRCIYRNFDWLLEGKGPDDRKAKAYDSKYDFGKIVDSYPGAAFAPSLEELGY